MILLKFDIEEKVKIKATGRKGIIKEYKVEGVKVDGVKQHKIMYLVDFGRHMIDWVKEDCLDHYNEYKFDKKFEIGLLNFLIDINLDKKNLEMVKYLHDLKKNVL